ncbi:DUF6310 domain-containing protein [Myxococcus vastator]|uniref:DUF6310 domain-containing protein n=1 Tax=Myxococcus vastator TaxID=2709664 RepID=UPI00353195C6
MPLDRERRPECRPVLVPHAGRVDSYNECADRFPPNHYSGMDVLVNGIWVDALQVGVRVLWEIKTHQFDMYFGFVIGVSTQAHKEVLLAVVPSLRIVVTGCKR